MATIEESLIQDAAADDESVYAISVGDGFNGMLDSRFDEDWIRVELVEGKMYDITLSGIGPDVDTDTVLRIYNPEGVQVGFHDDVDYAAGKVNSRLTFSPEATATYYISAGAYRGNPTQDNSDRYQVAVYEADHSLILTGTSYSDYLHTKLTGSIGDAGNDTAIYTFSDEGVEVRLHSGVARGGPATGRRSRR